MDKQTKKEFTTLKKGFTTLNKEFTDLKKVIKNGFKTQDVKFNNLHDRIDDLAMMVKKSLIRIVKSMNKIE